MIDICNFIFLEQKQAWRYLLIFSSMFSFQALFVYLQLHGWVENERNQELTRDWKLSKWGGSLARAPHRSWAVHICSARAPDRLLLPTSSHQQLYISIPREPSLHTPCSKSATILGKTAFITPDRTTLDKEQTGMAHLKKYLQLTFNQEQESSQVGFSTLLKMHLNENQ